MSFPRDQKRVLLFWLCATVVPVALAAIVFCVSRKSPIGHYGSRVYQDLENLKTQLQLYESVAHCLPSTTQGLSALIAPPEGEPRPKQWRQFLNEIPSDPWGNLYQYRFPATKSPHDPYDLFSCGKDRLPDTSDDIGNW